jgi:hypothetical protein
MKRILAVALIATMVTGCASTPPMSHETATNICLNAGVKKGTSAFVDCLTSVMNSEAAKGKPSFAAQYMLNRASNPGLRSSDVICRPWGNGVRCEEW